MVLNVGDKVTTKKAPVKSLTVVVAGKPADGKQEQVQCEDEQGTVQTYWADQLQK